MPWSTIRKERRGARLDFSCISAQSHNIFCTWLAGACTTPLVDLEQARSLTFVGYEKKLRLYDLDKMDAEPFVIEGVPDKVRCMAWHQDDTLLLTSYIDKPGIGQVPLHFTSPFWSSML